VIQEGQFYKTIDLILYILLLITYAVKFDMCYFFLLKSIISLFNPRVAKTILLRVFRSQYMTSKNESSLHLIFPVGHHHVAEALHLQPVPKPSELRKGESTAVA